MIVYFFRLHLLKIGLEGPFANGNRNIPMRERERERENLFDFALRTDTIIRLIKHKKKITSSKSQGASRNLSVIESRCSLISAD